MKKITIIIYSITKINNYLQEKICNVLQIDYPESKIIIILKYEKNINYVNVLGEFNLWTSMDLSEKVQKIIDTSINDNLCVPLYINKKKKNMETFMENRWNKLKSKNNCRGYY